MSKFKEGDRVANGRYELKRFLGEGTYGEVWQVRDTALDADCAIKFYVSLDERGREQFKEEYIVAHGLHHPNLLTATYYDVWENRPYLVMDYCEQGASDKQCGKIDEQGLWRFIRDVASGLAYLHNLQPDPIIHQDIKPENVLIGKNGYLITDFGVSMNMRSTMRKQSGRDGNENGGAIAYMGPERFMAQPNPIKASDIWSLGASIYEMATGELPFCGMGGGMQKNGAELPVLPAEWSRDLNNLVRACLAKDTWDRPLAQNIADYAAAKVQGEKPVPIWKGDDLPIKPVPVNPPKPISVITPVDPTPKPKPKKTWKIIVGVIVALVVFGVIIIKHWVKEIEAEETQKRYDIYMVEYDYCRSLISEGSDSNYDALIEARSYLEGLYTQEEFDSAFIGTGYEWMPLDGLADTLNRKIEKACATWEKSTRTFYDIGDMDLALSNYLVVLKLDKEGKRRISELEWYAIMNGDKEIMDLLAERGWEIDSVASDEEMALVAYDGDYDWVVQEVVAEEVAE